MLDEKTKALLYARFNIYCVDGDEAADSAFKLSLNASTWNLEKSREKIKCASFGISIIWNEAKTGKWSDSYYGILVKVIIVKLKPIITKNIETSLQVY